MECPKCGFEQAMQIDECPRCGIVFSKIQKAREPVKRPFVPVEDEEVTERQSIFEFIKGLFFDVEFEINPFLLGGRVLFFIVMIFWGIVLMSASIESNHVAQSFWHLVNLPFHEAGHVVFRPFGRIMHSMGGSMGQLLMPLICFAVFLLKTRDQFAASFSIWWLGENFLDMAPYINDARSLSLPLLGGNTGYSSPYGFHDWEFILKELGLARYDHFLAGCARLTGIFLMLLSFVWCTYILVKQNKCLK